MTTSKQPSEDTAKNASPNATSPGNEGARGSRGQANSGAQADNSTQADGNSHADVTGETDLRDDIARGGGGAGSESSRSK